MKRLFSPKVKLNLDGNLEQEMILMNCISTSAAFVDKTTPNYIASQGETTKQIVSTSGSGSSCQATVTEQPTKSSPAVGTGGTKSPQSPQVSSEKPSSQPSSSSPSQDSPSPAASQSSSNLPAIVCSAVFGSGGLIGGGILIYKCIR
ncbi:hypothetical protein BdWA1_000207 [Babesia duncani]|uniref:Uncharacterized protein n=1 Tax=Babesia duncani TaxID=323732 RepID=A0AAD9PLX7_9APIC|nr:hypothetical protein BdWA1_000207 [Babesia duncani]